ncbi:DUF2746 domain-containing protein [Mycolicibacterium fortuitum]|uniref:DUF2746 domain-containing protein n=1 Tax=Mycolicibacterium fortuitum TaxID=1766 RepID=UPI0011645CE2|nr:DUF2746 domain-containing protein [Mycolicibacterium fortuitum]QDF19324.1 hypothetical protein SEA_CRACKLEWINK_37 [Mycobacterium phage Cracklewink]
MKLAVAAMVVGVALLLAAPARAALVTADNASQLPANNIGLVGLVILTVGGWVTAWINGRNHRSEVRDIKGDVGDVKQQVQNSHNTNLRDDLDKVKQSQEDMKRMVESVEAGMHLLSQQMGDLHRYATSQGRDIGGIREDVGAMRGEIRRDRTAREAFEHSVREAHRKLHPEADPI